MVTCGFNILKITENLSRGQIRGHSWLKFKFTVSL